MQLWKGNEVTSLLLLMDDTSVYFRKEMFFIKTLMCPAPSESHSKIFSCSFVKCHQFALSSIIPKYDSHTDRCISNDNIMPYRAKILYKRAVSMLLSPSCLTNGMFCFVLVTELQFSCSCSYVKKALAQIACPSRQAILTTQGRIIIKQLVDREKMCP